MLRRLLGGPDAGRNAVLAVLPVLVGAILLLGSGDRPSTENSLLETTPGPAWPTLLEDPGPTSTSVASATSAGDESAGPTMAESVSPAAAGPADSTSPLTAGQTAAGSGTEAAGSPAGLEDGAGSGAALRVDAAPIEDSSTTADPTADATPGAGPTSTSEAPTTQAAETTTTTTLTAPPPAATTGGTARDRAVEAEVVPLTNQDRSAQGLGALSRNACLDSVASGYAEQMARSGVLAHNPGAGPAVHGCRPNSSWGDNVGTAAPCDTARLEREWMASPGHRRNILDGGYTLIGVGAWTDDQGGCWVQVLFSS